MAVAHHALPNGWLLQAWRAINHTTRGLAEPGGLKNHARMATGPAEFYRCLSTLVPSTTDVVLLGFADICSDPEDRALGTSKVAFHLEHLLRELTSRSDPPTVLLWNFWKWRNWNTVCTGTGPCSHFENCEVQLNDLAMYYGVNALSVRGALFHEARCRGSAHYFRKWTTDFTA